MTCYNPFLAKKNLKALASSLTPALGNCGFKLKKWLSYSHNILKSLSRSEFFPNIEFSVQTRKKERVLGMS